MPDYSNKLFNSMVIYLHCDFQSTNKTHCYGNTSIPYFLKPGVICCCDCCAVALHVKIDRQRNTATIWNLNYWNSLHESSYSVRTISKYLYVSL